MALDQSGICPSCATELPENDRWGEARALLCAGAERISLAERLREWPVKAAMPLFERWDRQCGLLARCITALKPVLEPRLATRGLLDALHSELLISLPVTPETFEALISPLTGPSAASPAGLEKIAADHGSWLGRTIAAVAALRAGSKADHIRHTVESGALTDHAVALECLTALADWRVQASWPKGYTRHNSGPWVTPAVAVAAYRARTHPTAGPWAMALAAAFIARHDQPVRDDETHTPGLEDLRSAAAALLQEAQATLANLPAGNPHLRFTLGLALGDEPTLAATTESPDPDLRAAAMRAYAALGSRLSTLRTSRLREAILKAPPEEALRLMSQLPPTEDANVIELLAALYRAGGTAIRDKALDRLIGRTPYGQLPEAPRAALVAFLLAEAPATMSLKEALNCLHWIVRDEEWPYTACAPALGLVERITPAVHACPPEEHLPLIRETFGFDDWLTIAVATGQPFPTTWSTGTSDEALLALTQKLSWLDARLSSDMMESPPTLAVFLALWQGLDHGRRPLVADQLGKKWLRDGLRHRTAAVTALAARYVDQPAERPGLLCLLWEDLDRLIEALAASGTPLLEDPPAQYPVLALMEPVRPYDLLQRILKEITPDAFAALLPAVFTASRQLLRRGATTGIPPLKLMLSTAMDRHEKAPDCAVWSDAVETIWRDWQILAREAVASGWPDTGSHYFESFVTEISDDRVRLGDRVRRLEEERQRMEARRAAEELRQLRSELGQPEVDAAKAAAEARDRAIAEAKAEHARQAEKALAGIRQRQELMSGFQAEVAALMASALPPAEKTARMAVLAAELQKALAAIPS